MSSWYGLRVSEAASLRLDHISELKSKIVLKDGWVLWGNISCTNLKQSSEEKKVLPVFHITGDCLLPCLCCELQRYLKKHSWCLKEHLFPGFFRWGSVRHGILYPHFEKILKISGVDKAVRPSGYGRGFHGFRHFCIANMKKRSGNVNLCKAITGHKSDKFFQYGADDHLAVAHNLADVWESSPKDHDRLQQIEKDLLEIKNILTRSGVVDLSGVQNIENYL